MKQLLKLIEEAAPQLLMVDKSDLPGLAQLHSLFEKIAEQASEMDIDSVEHMQTIQSASITAGELLGKVMLSEIEDATGAIKIVTETATAMQAMLEKIINGGNPDQVSFPRELGLACSDKNDEQLSDNDRMLRMTLPDNVDEDIFQEFLSAQPHVLASLEEKILTAENDPSPDNRVAIKGILHNLKGEAGLMGLQEVSSYCHETESLLTDDEAAFPAEKLLAAKDWLQAAMAVLSGDTSDISLQETEFGQTPEEKENNTNTDNASSAQEPEPEKSITIDDGDVPLVTDFINESNEHLESAEGDLLAIEDDPEDTERINAIFRAFHTIKGVAGFLNLIQIGSLAHTTENLLDLVRKGTLSFSDIGVDIVFESIDVMKQMLNGLQNAIENSQPFEPYNQLQELIDRIKICASGETPAPRLGEILQQGGAVDRNTVKIAIKEQQGGGSDKKLGEILVDKGAATPKQVKVALEEQKTTQKTRSLAKAKKVTAESTVKVTTGRLDSLINMVGELVIAQAMVSQDLDEHTTGNQRLARNSRHLNKITRELQELSMSMRMVPVQGVFQKMARLVRDLSRKAGKEIEFVMTGAETELDRNVVEAIADPLVHMVRNSVDHGIETPDKRESAGKRRTGKIELKAFHQGGNIVIEISDDGNGLNRDLIFQKAVANGIIKEDQEMTDQEVYRLIFHAGLSTAEKVTDVSGRGVGMDVVRKNIEALRGRVDIDSQAGRGSIFSIRLPLTLAVIDGLVITVGEEKFIIPILAVEQNFRPTPDLLSTVQNGRGEMLMIRGNLLPMIRLHKIFDIEPRFSDPCDALAVVITDGEKRSCLLVDDLLGQQQVVIKSLGEYLGAINGVSGGAIMGDGNVALILDVAGLAALV